MVVVGSTEHVRTRMRVPIGTLTRGICAEEGKVTLNVSGSNFAGANKAGLLLSLENQEFEENILDHYGLRIKRESRVQWGEGETNLLPPKHVLHERCQVLLLII